jgi:hypothetical protein
MTELSLEASKLIDVGREAFRPTEADRARVFAAVMGAAPLVGGAAVIGISKVSLADVAKAGIAKFVPSARAAYVLAVAMPVAAAAGGIVWYATVDNTAHHSTVPVPTAPRAAVFSSPSALPPPTTEVMPTPGDETERNTPEPATAPRPATPAADTSNTAGQIREEVALLTRAQAELSRGRAQQALEALREHAQRFPRGALTNERIATRARALCALGRQQEADAELDRVERLNPGSPYWVRAREACNGK